MTTPLPGSLSFGAGPNVNPDGTPKLPQVIQASQPTPTPTTPPVNNGMAAVRAALAHSITNPAPATAAPGTTPVDTINAIRNDPVGDASARQDLPSYVPGSLSPFATGFFQKNYNPDGSVNPAGPIGQEEQTWGKGNSITQRSLQAMQQRTQPGVPLAPATNGQPPVAPIFGAPPLTGNAAPVPTGVPQAQPQAPTGNWWNNIANMLPQLAAPQVMFGPNGRKSIVASHAPLPTPANFLHPALASMLAGGPSMITY